MRGARHLSALAIVMVAVVLQVSLVSRIRIGGVSPDIVILAVTSLALLTDSVRGAAWGFVAGIALALCAGIELGPHAIVAVIVGYTAGRLGEQLVTDEHPAPPIVVGALGAAAMQVGRPVIDYVLWLSSSVNGAVFRDAAIVMLVDAVLALPAYRLIRRIAGGRDSFVDVGVEV